eukprot:gene328-30604_t
MMISSSRTVCLAVLSVLAAASAQDFKPSMLKFGTHRIVNGQEAEKGKYPWIVALEAKVKGDDSIYGCGGSLIAPGYVLTAAHCYYPARTSDIGSVCLGAHNAWWSSCEGQEVKIASVAIHPDYDEWTTDNDIAILKLATDVTSITPVKLADTAYAADAQFSSADIKAVTLGWGTSDYDEKTSPDTLHVGNVNMVNRNDCGTKFAYDQSQITTGMVCAYSPVGTDSCQGDSGGPLYVESRNVQVGVVSWGEGCGFTDYPGVYTDVGYYNTWITGILENGIGGGGGGGGGNDPTDAPATDAPDSDACKCLDSWEWESTTYTGCQETPDDPNGAWCYTADVCSSTGSNWAYCDKNDSNSTNAPATEPADPTNASTDAPETQVPGTNVPPTESPTTDDTDPCQCLDEWEWESATYNGCQETPDDPNGAWCYTADVCSSTGSNWAYCDKNDDSADAPTDAPPTQVPTDAPTDGPQAACECQSEWEFEGATYQQCATTPDDANAAAAGTQRVVNGQDAEKGKYPSLVFVEARNTEGSFACGGTLIAPGYVLSAAHCFYPRVTDDFFGSTFVGAHDYCFGADREECGKEVKIDTVSLHPDYDPSTFANDVAIIKLASDVTWIKPIKLAVAGYAANTNFGSSTDKKAVVVGWGVDAVGPEGYEQSSAETLQVGDANMMNRNDCGEKYAYDGLDILPGMVCAGSPDLDEHIPGEFANNAITASCQGDSGGPLIVPSRNEQVGVVSWGIGCDQYGHPGVYADVGYYNKWITGIAGDLNGPSPPLTPAPPSPTPASSPAPPAPTTEPFTMYTIMPTGAPPAPTPAPPAWCYLVAECDGAVESSVKPGTFWTTCDDSNVGTSEPTNMPPTNMPPTNMPPTDSTTDAPTTEASTSTDAVASACGVGSFPTLMENGICPAESHELVATKVDCEAVAMELSPFLGMNDLAAQTQNNKKRPRGCYMFKGKLFFNNKGKLNSKNKKRQSICCSVASSSTSSSTMAPGLDVDNSAGGSNDNDNANDGSSCKCKESWRFDGVTYEQCAFTPDDPNNSWCYTESECVGSASSDTYAGDSWAFCNIRENKRLALGGAVKHSAAKAAASSAEASGTEPDSGAAGGAATMAAGVVAALLVVGAIVGVAVHRSRSRHADGAPPAAPTIDNIENGAADVLERADSYYDALAASTTINFGAADFEAAAFVLDAAAGGSLKVKSVRRPNPVYRSSAYIENADTEGI